MNRPIGMLTADVDDLTGTENDDTFTAGLTVAGSETLQTFDTVEGGEGTDTLNATIDSDVDTPTLDSVEVLNVRSLDTSAALGLDNATGVEQIWTDRSAADLTVDEVAGPVAIGAKNVTADDVDYTVEYASGALSATDTEQSLALNNATLADVTINGATGVDTLNVDLQGGDNAIGVNKADSATGLNIASATLETINLSGEGSLNLNQSTAVKTIDGADVTGDLQLTIGALAGSLSGARAVTTGSGDDVVDVSALTDLSSAIAIDGGAGRDEIVVGADTTIEQLVEKASNFEVLNIAGLEGSDSTTTPAEAVVERSYAAYANVGYEALVLTDAELGTGNDQAVSITGLTADSDLTLVNTNGKADSIDLAVTGAATANDTAFGLTVEGRDGDSTFNINADDVQTLNVTTVSNSQDSTHSVSTLNLTGVDSDGNDTLENVVITGDEAVDVDLTSNADAVETVDVSGVTADSNVVGANAEYAATVTVGEDVTVTGSAGADLITFDLGSSITGGAGDDVFALDGSGTAATNNFATITDFGDGSDSLYFGAADGSTVNFIASAEELGTDGIEISEVTFTPTPGNEATFADYIAAAGDGVGYFEFADNTYVIESDGSASVDTEGAITGAQVVELTGTVDLSGFAYDATAA